MVSAQFIVLLLYLYIHFFAGRVFVWVERQSLSKNILGQVYIFFKDLFYSLSLYIHQPKYVFWFINHDKWGIM